jgi:26S proteasome regulatory subunit N4
MMGNKNIKRPQRRALSTTFEVFLLFLFFFKNKHLPMMAQTTLLNTLIAQREALELEADAIGSELRSPGPNGEPPAGLKDKLVDKEGFPRADIDIYRVRTLRGRLAVLNTDHKALMKTIEAEVTRLHGIAGANGHMAGASSGSGLQRNGNPEDDDVSINTVFTSTTTAASTAASTDTSTFSLDTYINLKAFAIIDEILPDSPASLANLQNGDRLIQFGVEDGNGSGIGSRNLQDIPNIVRAAYGSNASIKLIIRTSSTSTTSEGDEGELVTRVLTPAVWSGRGLLGLHLTPISQ